VQCTVIDGSGQEITFDPALPAMATHATVVEANLEAIACPSSLQCTAVGPQEEVTFDPALPASATDSTVGAGSAVACPSGGQCTSIDGNSETTFVPTDPGGSSPVMVDSGQGMQAVACPSAATCVGVDLAGQTVSFDPSSPPTPTIAQVDDTFLFDSLACASADQCVAVSEDGFDWTIGGTPSGPSSYIIDRLGFTAVACPSSTECTGVDGSGGELTFAPNPDDSEAVSTPQIDSEGEPTAVACAVVGQCTAVDDVGNEVTFDPAGPGATQSVSSVTSASVDTTALSSVSCPLPSQCTAVDSDGNEVTFFPPAQSGASTADIDGGTTLTSVACPASDQCTAVDVEGTAVTFNPDSPAGASSAGIDSNELTGIACPTTTFCVAIDAAGYAAQFDPQAPLGPGYSVDWLDGAQWLLSVSCYSAEDCKVLDNKGFLYLGTGSPSAPTSSTPPQTSGVPSPVTAGTTTTTTTTAPKPAASPTTSRGQLVLSTTGKARLRFEVKAGANAPAIETLSVSLPSGFAFETGKDHGVAVAAREGFTAVLRSGRLVITLKPDATRATVRIFLTEGRKLHADLRKRSGALRRDNLDLGVSITDATGHATKSHLDFVKRMR
jgi:hypothetical protein